MGGYSAYSAYSACSAYSAKSAYSTYFAYSAYSAYCYLLSKNIKHHRSVVCSFICLCICLYGCLCISIFLDPAWRKSYSESFSHHLFKNILHHRCLSFSLYLSLSVYLCLCLSLYLNFPPNLDSFQGTYGLRGP